MQANAPAPLSPDSAGKAADPDPAGPGGGPRRGVAVAQLEAQLHPEPPQHVLAAIAAARRLRAPPGVSGRDLDDRALAGRGERGVDFASIGFALHAEHPAHRVHPPDIPVRVEAGGCAAPDSGRLARRRRAGDPLLHRRGGGDRRRQRREVAERAPYLPGESKRADLVAVVDTHAVILRCGRRTPSVPAASRQGERKADPAAGGIGRRNQLKWGSVAVTLSTMCRTWSQSSRP